MSASRSSSTASNVTYQRNGNNKKFMAATTATPTCKTLLYNGSNSEIFNNGVNFSNNNVTSTLMQPSVYASYASQQFHPTYSSANGTDQSSMCSTPASASAVAAAAAMATASMFNGQQQYLLKYQQQSALQQYYNSASASSSLIPIIPNSDINAIANSALTPVDFHVNNFLNLKLNKNNNKFNK